MKDTKQKEAILSALSTMHTHPTADDIYETVRKDFPRISLGTIYRNLSTFSESGAIKKVEIPGSKDRFDYRTGKHDHLVCSNCGNIFDINADIDINVKDLGIEINHYNLIIYGVCQTCCSKRV